MPNLGGPSISVWWRASDAPFATLLRRAAGQSLCLGGAGPGASAQQRFRPPGQAPAPSRLGARGRCRVARPAPRHRRGAARRLAGRRRPADPRHTASDRSRPGRAGAGRALARRDATLDPRRRWSAGFRQPAGGAGRAPGRLLRERRRSQPAPAVRGGPTLACRPARRRVAGAAPPGAGRLLSSRRTGAVRRPRRLPRLGRLALGQRRPAHRLPDPARRHRRRPDRRHRRTVAA